MMITFPPLISKQQFLTDYWQKQPLLFRSAMKNSEQLISKQQLFELSLDENIESRLLMEDGPEQPWQVFHGPQQLNQLQALAKSSHWTLLVQSVNLWHSGCAKLLQDFTFIPEWRLDDIMISYASESGSVGAHIDHYDVFLIQLSGTRRWIIGEPDGEVEELDTPFSQQLIKPFPAIIDQVLEAGDMLYLPPDTAHHGISIEPGMTLSIGFRSPALSEMMMIFAEQIMHHSKESYYSDPQLPAENTSGEISPTAMSKAVNWFSSLDEYTELKQKSFGLLQTQPKQELLLSALDLTIQQSLSKKLIIERDPAGRVAWYQANEAVIWLFINGECFERPVDEKPWIEHLSSIRTLTVENLSGLISDDRFINLLQLFVDAGLFGLK